MHALGIKVMAKKRNHGPRDTTIVSCRRCRHYYVTWDKHFPNGCRAIGFKSKSSPSSRVLTASGIECQLFLRKEPGKEGER